MEQAPAREGPEAPWRLDLNVILESRREFHSSNRVFLRGENRQCHRCIGTAPREPASIDAGDSRPGGASWRVAVRSVAARDETNGGRADACRIRRKDLST